MRLYLDTADRKLAEPLLATGLFAGLTTNPVILARAGCTVADIPAIHGWARAAGAREIFFQAWGPDTTTLVRRGLQLRELGDDVVVKVPASLAGSAACADLARRGLPTLLTAVYDPASALVAAAAGATYLAPYLGKLNEAGRDGLAAVESMQAALAGTTTRILLASLRDTASLVATARFGVEHFTMAPAIAQALFADPLTAEAVQGFEEAAAA